MDLLIYLDERNPSVAWCSSAVLWAVGFLFEVLGFLRKDHGQHFSGWMWDLTSAQILLPPYPKELSWRTSIHHSWHFHCWLRSEAFCAVSLAVLLLKVVLLHQTLAWKWLQQWLQRKIEERSLLFPQHWVALFLETSLWLGIDVGIDEWRFLAACCQVARLVFVTRWEMSWPQTSRSAGIDLGVEQWCFLGGCCWVAPLVSANRWQLEGLWLRPLSGVSLLDVVGLHCWCLQTSDNKRGCDFRTHLSDLHLSQTLHSWRKRT